MWRNKMCQASLVFWWRQSTRWNDSMSWRLPWKTYCFGWWAEMANKMVCSRGHHTSPTSTSSLGSENHIDLHCLKYTPLDLHNIWPNQLGKNKSLNLLMHFKCPILHNNIHCIIIHMSQKKVYFLEKNDLMLLKSLPCNALSRMSSMVPTRKQDSWNFSTGRSRTIAWSRAAAMPHNCQDITKYESHYRQLYITPVIFHQLRILNKISLGIMLKTQIPIENVLKIVQSISYNWLLDLLS